MNHGQPGGRYHRLLEHVGDPPETADPDADQPPSHVGHAIALCEGDLLGTWQHDWVLRERDRLHVLRLDLLERLTDHYVARGAVTAGLAHGRRLLGVDPTRETTHRQAGVSTDCCVLSTAVAAADAGVPVRVVSDACAGADDDSHAKALDLMSLYAPLIEVVPSAELLSATRVAAR